MTTLVFKFRDDLLPRRGAAWLKFMNLPDTFFDNADIFIRQTRTTSNLMGWMLGLFAFLDVRNWIATLLKGVNGIPLMPYSPFGGGNYEKLSRLAQRVRTYDPNRVVTLPNLFNYFQIDFPEGTREETIQFVMNLFEDFLPHTSRFGFYLFDFAYLKNEPVSLSESSPLDALKGKNGVGQFYFADMSIPAAGKAPAGITIIEANGWDLSHTQFTTINPKPDIRPIEDNPFQVATLTTKCGVLDHGTQILGILAASDQNNDQGVAPTGDLCRGIVPNLIVRLVSCLDNRSKLNADQTFKNASFSEAAAVLTAIDCTPSGDTILIELGTAGGRYPLDIQPLVYELLTYADTVQITVVAAAGNEGAILDTIPAIPAGQGEPLKPRDIRAQEEDALVKKQLNHSEPFWNAYDTSVKETKSGKSKANKRAVAFRARIEALYQAHQGRVVTTAASKAVPRFGSVTDFLAYYQETPSPAILVGAANRILPDKPADPVGFTLDPSSSRGNRVKVFAQGSGILTTTINQGFTTDMSSTSGAAAIIGGVVVLLQQKAKAAGTKVLSPQTVADWLTKSANSRPVTNTDAGQQQVVGVVPSGKAVLDHVPN